MKINGKKLNFQRFNLLVAVLAGLSVAAGGPAEVRLVMTTTAAVETVFVAGNRPELGNWDPAAVRLEPSGDGRFALCFPAAVGDTVEYKFTRGSWATEALDEAGVVPPNHRLIVAGDTTVEHQITHWRNQDLVSGAGICGMVRYHRRFYSPELDNYRDLIVWLPPSYASDTTCRYPVVYMHDGQNIIDPATSYGGHDWQVDEAATELIGSGALPEIIVVGIYNTPDRTAEYSPQHNGRRYSAFVISTVKPLIDSTYRTLSDARHTVTIGSSMGGLIAFHLAWEHPDVFAAAGCFSPAFLVDDEEIVQRVRQGGDSTKPIRLYIDNGSVGLERRLQPAIDHLLPLLHRAGFTEGCNLRYLRAKGAEHNEEAWAARLPAALVFLLAPED